MTDVVVLGAGVGGVSAAYDLRKTLPREVNVKVISERPQFQFTPSNPWVAVGWRTGEQISVDLTEPFRKKGIELIVDAAARLDPEARCVRLASGASLDYDFLVIATGPELAFDEIEGLGPDGFTTSVCTTGHAAKARADVDALVANPGPVVVGAAQGASCYGPAYEYAFILDTELRKRKLRDRVPMHFVTAEPYVGHLGLDGVGDTKSLLESELRNRHITAVTNAKIDTVEAGVMHVTTVDMEGIDVKSQAIEFAHAMVLPAFRGIAAVRDIQGLVNPRGFIVVDEHQRNPKYPEIYAVGVCVAIPPVSETPLPVGAPKTGYMIESMVSAATANIVRALRDQPPEQIATWNAVCLADFGDSGVAFVALPQIPPRNTNWAARGKWVHVAKIGFEKYFLRKVRRGNTEPYFEKTVLDWLGITKLKAS